MSKSGMIFAGSYDKKVVVNMNSFVNASYRDRRTEDALTFNMGSVGSLRRQATLHQPEARDAFMALKKAAEEPGSQLVYIRGDDGEDIINLGKVIAAVYCPEDPNKQFDLWLEMVGFSMMVDGAPANQIWKALGAYAELELA